MPPTYYVVLLLVRVTCQRAGHDRVRMFDAHHEPPQWCSLVVRTLSSYYYLVSVCLRPLILISHVLVFLDVTFLNRNPLDLTSLELTRIYLTLLLTFPHYH